MIHCGLGVLTQQQRSSRPALCGPITLLPSQVLFTCVYITLGILVLMTADNITHQIYKALSGSTHADIGRPLSKEQLYEMASARVQLLVSCPGFRSMWPHAMAVECHSAVAHSTVAYRCMLL